MFVKVFIRSLNNLGNNFLFWAFGVFQMTLDIIDRYFSNKSANWVEVIFFVLNFVFSVTTYQLTKLEIEEENE